MPDRLPQVNISSVAVDSGPAEREAVRTFASQGTPNAAHDATPHNETQDHPTASEPAEILPCPFGRYELQKMLGRGGMGSVFLAVDRQLDRTVALKIPRPVTDGSNAWRARFATEAKAAATLSHPNICPVFDVGEVDGQPYLTMAFIDGETLAARLHRTGRLNPQEAVDLVRTVARAMAYRFGVVHRDLKPANLMIDRRGEPIVTDFGLAIRSAPGDDLRLTFTGVALGTPAYMPPEQAGGDTSVAGPASDAYSLGVILFELVTGRVPFQAGSFGKLLAQIERDTPPRPSSVAPHVDTALDAIVLTCLAKEPGERFPTATALADALEAYLGGERSGLLSRYGAVLEASDSSGVARDQGSTESLFLLAGRKSPPSRGRIRKLGPLLAAASLGALVSAGALIFRQTPPLPPTETPPHSVGHVELHIDPPDAKVHVAVNGHPRPEYQPSHALVLPSGHGQALTLTAAGFEPYQHHFDLPVGETVRISAMLVRTPSIQVTPSTQPDRNRSSKSQETPNGSR